MAFTEDEENVLIWSFLIVTLGKNQENNTTLQFCGPVSTGNKWHSHQVSGACCSVAARGSWGFCHAPWLGMHLNPAFLTWLDWESPAPSPCWQCWQQCHLRQAPSTGLFLSSGQVLHRSHFHITTALAATLVYSIARPLGSPSPHRQCS